MEALFDHSLSTGSTVLLFVCLLVALGFEFVNGFHDTANAVATVIYTNSLKPRVAVVLSGLFNFSGVFAGGIGVAMGIIKLLPVELLVSSGPGAGLAMVLALLVAAIGWNLGTWYFGLPSSSSHTLIGSILGVGLANSLTAGHVFGDGVNWSKAQEIGLSLLVSPLVGFGSAFALFALIRRYTKNPALLEAPKGEAPPPPGTRAILIGTCSAVSFAHGSNDGQKGVGLVMLILMGLLPANFALRPDADGAAVERTRAAAQALIESMKAHGDEQGQQEIAKATSELDDLIRRLGAAGSVSALDKDARFPVRQDILLADRSLSLLLERGHLGLTPEERKALDQHRKDLRSLTEYAPSWVLVAIALALGIGTMVGWKRIVVTVGEKIGKSHLTYAQGMSAELVAATAIGLASVSGLPVSTTHVLSSGIAGTMVAHRSGLNASTVRSIALAWLLTLPVSMLLSGALYLGFRQLLT
ncbi:MAG: inorganic phosphate transporter [Myxococcaceae bacterium]|nr:inorganic phosphate transporter [Myxococcaceae bacterium]